MIGAAFCAATAGHAQEEPAPPNDFEALKSCRSIAGDQERLACFDAAVGVVVAAQESGDLRIVDKEAANQTRRRLFGFALPDIGLFGDGKVGDEKQLDLLETTITSAQQIRRNAWVFQTEEGAVWQINGVPSRLRALEPGQRVIFKKAALNSYFVRIEGQAGVKGTRIG
ncbi:hypothetical protein [Allopontixanthobacter sp.]|uniref:hypothetical protein n=1 Tax=Allopontixanthobacter sp. TaxID=2906452 RepID=UPI002AB89B2D|nr:hypothetical protein [Allopontixanthobacter sp.]MDZ4307567.1 hypothetical protein [Allopontixanthobacter sp.]